MKRRQFLATCALAGLLGACGASPDTSGGPAGDQAAAQQFLTERNGGTPVALGLPKDGPLVGIVQSVDGQSLIVKEPLGGVTTTVRLAADAKIRKSVAALPGEIRAGAIITAFGAQDGDAYRADMIQLGGGDTPFMIARDLPGDPAPPSAAGPSAAPAGDKMIVGSPGAQTHAVSGTVEQADGATLVVKANDGTTTTVRLAEGTKITKQADVPLAELHAGDLIAATGAPSGDYFQATQVQIMPAAQQP
jgi:hypothetical protein